MSIKLKNLTPSIAIHPGELLKDELESRGIKQKEFAELIGVQPTQLNEIINRKRGLNAELALLIGTALKMDAKIWINIQNNYELDLAKINKKIQKRLQTIDQWLLIQQHIPEKFYKKTGYLSGNPVDDIGAIKEIYNIDNFEQLTILINENLHYKFSKTSQTEIDKTDLIGWTKLINYEASKIKVASFNTAAIDTLITKLKDVFWKNKNTIRKTKDVLSEFGIKLVIIENPEKCPIDGYAFWNKSNPSIGLTLRHNRIDNFAFTLFHELGHILLHVQKDKDAKFVDLESDEIGKDHNKEESEADAFAKDHLISAKLWKEFLASPGKTQEKDIINLAKNEKVHPAIVKGLLSQELNNEKVRIRVDHTIN
jgi:HTH-type transcriptional regulator/antitoxin HigA